MENSEASVVLQVEVGHNAYITTLEKKTALFRIHKTVKTNNKIQRFGVVMTPLSRKNVFDHADYSI